MPWDFTKPKQTTEPSEATQIEIQGKWDFSKPAYDLTEHTPRPVMPEPPPAPPPRLYTPVLDATRREPTPPMFPTRPEPGPPLAESIRMPEQGKTAEEIIGQIIPPAPVDTVTGAAPSVGSDLITKQPLARSTSPVDMVTGAAATPEKLAQPRLGGMDPAFEKNLNEITRGFGAMGRGIVRGLTVDIPGRATPEAPERLRDVPAYAAGKVLDWAYDPNKDLSTSDKANQFVGEVLGHMPFYLMGGQLIGAAVRSFGPTAKLGLSAKAIQQEAARQAIPTAQSAMGRVLQRGLQSAGQLAPRLGTIASARQAADEAVIGQEGSAQRIGQAATGGMVAGAILGFAFGSIAQAYPEAKFKIQTMRAGRRVALPKDTPTEFTHNEVQREIEKMLKEGWKHGPKPGTFIHPQTDRVATFNVTYRGKEIRLTELLRRFEGRVPTGTQVATTVGRAPTAAPAPAMGRTPAAAPPTPPRATTPAPTPAATPATTPVPAMPPVATAPAVETPAQMALRHGLSIPEITDIGRLAPEAQTAYYAMRDTGQGHTEALTAVTPAPAPPPQIDAETLMRDILTRGGIKPPTQRAKRDLIPEMLQSKDGLALTDMAGQLGITEQQLLDSLADPVAPEITDADVPFDDAPTPTTMPAMATTSPVERDITPAPTDTITGGVTAATEAPAVTPPDTAPVETAPAVGKQPWEMTRAEFKSVAKPSMGRVVLPDGRTITPQGSELPLVEQAHNNLIGEALLEGKNVPAEVLEEYPRMKGIARRIAAGEISTTPPTTTPKAADTPVEQPKAEVKGVTPAEPATKEIALQKGDYITDGLIRGEIVGEGTLGKAPAWKVEQPDGKAGFIIKNDPSIKVLGGELEAQRVVRATEAEKEPAKPEVKKAKVSKTERYNELVESIAKENPLNKLKRGNIQAASTKGEIGAPFSAYKISDSLYVHKELDGKTQKPSRKQDASWMITAHPAGMGLGKYATPEEAVAMAVVFDRSGVEIGKTIEEIQAQAKKEAKKEQPGWLIKIRSDFMEGVLPEAMQVKPQKTLPQSLKNLGYRNVEEAQMAFQAKDLGFSQWAHTWDEDRAAIFQYTGENTPKKAYDKLTEPLKGLPAKEIKERRMDLQMFARKTGTEPDPEREKARRRFFVIANKLNLDRGQRIEMARYITNRPGLNSTTELTRNEMQELADFLNKHHLQLKAADQAKLDESRRVSAVKAAEAKKELDKALKGETALEDRIERQKELGYEVEMASDVYKLMGRNIPAGFEDHPVGWMWDKQVYVPSAREIAKWPEKELRGLTKENNIAEQYIKPIFRVLPREFTDDGMKAKQVMTAFQDKFLRRMNDAIRGFTAQERINVAAMLEGVLEKTGKEGTAADKIKADFFDPLFDQLVTAGKLEKAQYVSDYFSRISKEVKNISGDSLSVPKRWFTHSRTGKMEDYNKDVAEVANIYINAASKAIHVDSFLEKWKPEIKKWPKSKRGMAEVFADSVYGRPTSWETMMNQLIKDGYQALGKDLPEGRRPTQDVSRAIISAVVQAYMGFNPGSVIKNLTQKMLAVADVATTKKPLRGFKYLAQAQRFKMTKEGQEFVNKYCTLLKDRTYMEGLEKTSRYEWKINQILDATSRVTMWGFKRADISNVTDGFLIGLFAALEDGKPMVDALWQANDVALRTQFPYDIRKAMAFHNPVLRLAGLFSSWPINMFELGMDWVKPSKPKLPAAKKPIEMEPDTTGNAWSMKTQSEWSKLLLLAGLMGGLKYLMNKLGIHLRISMLDSASGHVVFKTATGEQGAVTRYIGDFGKVARRMTTFDTDEWVKAMEELAYLAPGGVAYRRIARFNRAAQDNWRLRDVRGRVYLDYAKEGVFYELTGIPGEAVRALIGQTTESNEHWRDVYPTISDRVEMKRDEVLKRVIGN